MKMTISHRWVKQKSDKHFAIKYASGDSASICNENAISMLSLLSEYHQLDIPRLLLSPDDKLALCYFNAFVVKKMAFSNLDRSHNPKRVCH